MYKYHKINASQYDIIAPGDMRVAIAGTDLNARRIVACLNACDGIPTKELEALPLEFGVMGEIDRLRKQIERLREALEKIILAHDCKNASYGAKMYAEEVQPAIEAARTALDSTSPAPA